MLFTFTGKRNEVGLLLCALVDADCIAYRLACARLGANKNRKLWRGKKEREKERNLGWWTFKLMSLHICSRSSHSSLSPALCMVIFLYNNHHVFIPWVLFFFLLVLFVNTLAICSRACMSYLETIWLLLESCFMPCQLGPHYSVLCILPSTLWAMFSTWLIWNCMNLYCSASCCFCLSVLDLLCFGCFPAAAFSSLVLHPHMCHLSDIVCT